MLVVDGPSMGLFWFIVVLTGASVRFCTPESVFILQGSSCVPKLLLERSTIFIISCLRDKDAEKNGLK